MIGMEDGGQSAGGNFTAFTLIQVLGFRTLPIHDLVKQS